MSNSPLIAHITKICTTCQEEKKIEDYNFKSIAKNLRHTACKECSRIAQRARKATPACKKRDSAWYRKNRLKVIARVKRNTLRRKLEALNVQS